MDRRGFLRATLVSGGAVMTPVVRSGVWSRAAWAATGSVQVYVVVVDGLRPDELVFMPTLTRLAGQGTFWPDGRAEMVAETTPNHVAMLTGMRADRHGMPGNAVPGRAGFNPRLGDNPRYLKGDTVFTVASRHAPDLTTAAVVSKEYLVHMSRHDRDGDGAPDADHVYQPRFFIPESDHEPDWLVMEEAMRVSRELDPDFLFVNLGDVDRMGHVDESGGLTGGQAPAGRRAVLVNTDTLIGGFVEQLQGDGKWDSTVLVVTADHGMDWSFPDRIVNLYPSFQEEALLADEVLVGVNGGAGLYALRSPARPRSDERRRRMREIAISTEGVAGAWYTRPNPADGGEAHWLGRVRPEWGLAGDRSGDLVVVVEPGWRITEPGATSNPIPGNHGHPVTLPIPVIIAGGWEGVRRRRIEPGGDPGPGDYREGQARNIDVAPTVAWLLGLGPPRGGFDGRVLDEAFAARPPAAAPVRDVVPGAHVERHAGPTVHDTAAAVSRIAFTGGADAVVIASPLAADHAVGAPSLAAAVRGPILFASRDGLPDAVAEEIRRLGPDAAYLVGPEDALGGGVVDDLEAAGVPRDRIVRLTGRNVVATAAGVAEEVGSEHGEIVLTGTDNASLAAAAAMGSVAAAANRPVLATPRDGLRDVTRDALDAVGATRATILDAGQGVADAVDDELRADGLAVERLEAGDRYAAGRLAADRGVREAGLTDVVWLAGGEDLAGLLVAAGAASAGTRPAETEEEDDPFWWMSGGEALAAPSALVPVAPARLDDAPASAEFLTDRRHEIVRVRIVGGHAAVSPAVEDEIRALLAHPGATADERDAPPGQTADEDARRALPATGGGAAAAGAALAVLALRLRSRAPAGADARDE